MIAFKLTDGSYTISTAEQEASWPPREAVDSAWVDGVDLYPFEGLKLMANEHGIAHLDTTATYFHLFSYSEKLSFLHQLGDAFGWLESDRATVEEVFLNESDLAEFRSLGGKFRCLAGPSDSFGLIAYLWGARVWSSPTEDSWLVGKASHTGATAQFVDVRSVSRSRGVAQPG